MAKLNNIDRNETAGKCNFAFQQSQGIPANSPVKFSPALAQDQEWDNFLILSKRDANTQMGQAEMCYARLFLSA